MKSRFSLLLSIGLLCFTFLSAQDQPAKHLRFLGLETGFYFVSGSITNMDYIRGDMPSYPYGYSTHNLSSQMDKFHFGIKSEYFSMNDKLGFASGLRYIQTNSSVGKAGYWRSGTDYFYVLTKQDGLNTEYLKVKEINQSSSYIGIPFEVRFFPTQPHIMRLFFKAGAELGYQISTKTDIVFADESMESYTSEVTALVDEPEGFMTSMYGSIGFRIGKENKPLVSVELCLPLACIAPKTPGLISPGMGGGFQLNVQIPCKSIIK